MTPDHRNAAAKAVQIGAAGLPIPAGARCTRCHRPIREDGHGGYCSHECAREASADLSQTQLRKLAFERDHGKCFSCAIDCEAIRRELDENKQMAEHGDIRAKTFAKNRVVFWAMAGFTDAEIQGDKSLWEAHHLTERAKGGTNTLANIATTCAPCHAKLTGDFSRARAKARKSRRGRFGR